MNVLEVSGLHVTFPGGVRAVRGLDLALEPGEALAVVGESGAGKSATALAMVGLLPGGVRVEGSVRLRGRELLGLGDRALAKIRGGDLALICQDQEFTPVYRIGPQIAEAIRLRAKMSRREATGRAIGVLRATEIPDAPRVARAFPHELSGGLLRRAMIAMAIAGTPAVILADEPTAGLDPPTQANVLESLRSYRSRTGAALLLITHDLGMAVNYADRVLVMREGRLVETGRTEEVFTHPNEPYTRALLTAAPTLTRPRPPDRPPAAEARQPGESAGGPSLDATRPPALGAGRTDSSAGPLLSSGRPTVAGRSHGGESPRDPERRATSPCTRPAGTGDAPVSPLPAPDRPPIAGGRRADERSGVPGRCVACPSTRAAEGHVAGIGLPEVAGDLPPDARSGRAVVLEVGGLVKHYPLRGGRPVPRRRGVVKAVDGAGLDIRAGETLGLVGESGCGKTTLLMEILRLGSVQGGRITVFGRDTATLSGAERRRLRRDLQFVFQDPLAALDPRMTAGALIAEPLRAHRRPGIAARVQELLRLTGLEPAHTNRRPGELSGGQRQRVGIARALALEPRLLLMDEPFSALDVSVQAGIIALLQELKTRLGLSYLLAAHDLAAVRRLADRVAVMRLGRIVEIGDADAVYETPAHPYTETLLAAVPLLDHHERTPPGCRQAAAPRRRTAVSIGPRPATPLPSPPREVLDAQDRPGCQFRTRCPVFATRPARDRHRCTDEQPELHPVGPDQAVACHFTLRSP
ncbi:ABC transporter ATP-binding protein [Actinomadura sp. DC4]|uniref:ATP-binding cassette domain-containing protein n=1 Tax=Actinomadura sp. DC4 TaxID=3055069 RepID=UPI0025B0BB1F|nr:ABC transporter ATP-binding protein [Actinomadura sp. DC4]MDN3353513.1 ABC transporter ATP-binding protein [Actinomadura sp. DC4]